MAQTTQLIARRIRGLSIYCRIFPWNVSEKERRIEIMKEGFVKLRFDITVPVNSFDVFSLNTPTKEP